MFNTDVLKPISPSVGPPFPIFMAKYLPLKGDWPWVQQGVLVSPPITIVAPPIITPKPILTPGEDVNAVPVDMAAIANSGDWISGTINVSHLPGRSYTWYLRVRKSGANSSDNTSQSQATSGTIEGGSSGLDTVNFTMALKDAQYDLPLTPGAYLYEFILFDESAGGVQVIGNSHAWLFLENLTIK